MTDHARLEQENAALRLRVAALEAALRETARWFDPMDTHGNLVNSAEQRSRIESALSGEPTALREMLVRAATAGWEAVPWSSRPDYGKDEYINDIVERILKGGGK